MIFVCLGIISGCLDPFFPLVDIEIGWGYLKRRKRKRIFEQKFYCSMLAEEAKPQKCWWLMATQKAINKRILSLGIHEASEICIVIICI